MISVKEVNIERRLFGLFKKYARKMKIKITRCGTAQITEQDETPLFKRCFNRRVRDSLYKILEQICAPVLEAMASSAISGTPAMTPTRGTHSNHSSIGGIFLTSQAAIQTRSKRKFPNYSFKELNIFLAS